MRIISYLYDVLSARAFTIKKGVNCMNITSENFIKHFRKKREDALEYVIDEYIGQDRTEGDFLPSESANC